MTKSVNNGAGTLSTPAKLIAADNKGIKIFAVVATAQEAVSLATGYWLRNGRYKCVAGAAVEGLKTTGVKGKCKGEKKGRRKW